MDMVAFVYVYVGDNWGIIYLSLPLARLANGYSFRQDV